MKVLITGGTGSLGNELVKQFLPQADRIVVYSRDEVKQAQMRQAFPQENVRFFLGDVRDAQRLTEAMYGVDTVIHAAALKRVDAVSYNPSEVFKTNAQGTMNVLNAAMDTDVSKVLFISSDKAVEPTNVYGASKLMGEFLTVRQNVMSIPQGMQCSVLRYGNVWGSRGSIAHVFREQANTGRLTVTDPTITRFFLTLPQAGQFVLRALELMQGGEIFVPILPAWTLAQVASLFASQWDTVGLRPGGEKLHEKLMTTLEEQRAHLVMPFYVIPPDIHEWTSKYWTEGMNAHYAKDWPYASNYARQVAREELDEALAQV